MMGSAQLIEGMVLGGIPMHAIFQDFCMKLASIQRYKG